MKDATMQKYLTFDQAKLAYDQAVIAYATIASYGANRNELLCAVSRVEYVKSNLIGWASR